jgi:hypothetical protein
MSKVKLLLFVMLLFFGCKNEDPAPEKFLSFKIAGGESVRLTNVTWFVLSDRTWVVAQNDTDNSQLRLLFPANFTVGDTFQIDSTQITTAIYIPERTFVMTADSGSIEITNFNSQQNRLEGKFQFSAKAFGFITGMNIEEGSFSTTY